MGASARRPFRSARSRRRPRRREDDLDLRTLDGRRRPTARKGARFRRSRPKGLRAIPRTRSGDEDRSPAALVDGMRAATPPAPNAIPQRLGRRARRALVAQIRCTHPVQSAAPLGLLPGCPEASGFPFVNPWNRRAEKVLKIGHDEQTGAEEGVDVLKIDQNVFPGSGISAPRGWILDPGRVDLHARRVISPIRPAVSPKRRKRPQSYRARQATKTGRPNTHSGRFSAHRPPNFRPKIHFGRFSAHSRTAARGPQPREDPCANEAPAAAGGCRGFTTVAGAATSPQSRARRREAARRRGNSARPWQNQALFHKFGPFRGFDAQFSLAGRCPRRWR